MKREAAWNGFYKALREIVGYEAIAKKEGHDCSVRTARRMAELRAKRFAKSLVYEHGWEDVHTRKFYRSCS